MQAQRSPSPHPLVWAVGTAILIFCLLGIAALMGWIPASFGAFAPGETGYQAPAASKPLLGTRPRPAAKTPGLVASQPAAPVACLGCGRVESTQPIGTGGDPSGVGVVGGAVIGGVLGHQVGGGTGKQLATLAGAVGGALAGNEVEKQMRAPEQRQRITIRFDDGSSQVFEEAGAARWQAGDRVQVVKGVVRAHG